MKPILLVPIAGKGQRFVDDGFHMPKPLIMVDDKHIIDWSFLSINKDEYDIVFVVRKEHVYNFGMDTILRNKFGENIKIVETDKITSGTVASCLLAKDFINNEQQLVIYTLDVHFQNKFSINNVDKDSDGFILTFKANNPAYSYAELDDSGLVLRTAEKEVISENAAVGIYYFKEGSTFVKYAEEMIDKNLRTNNEFYVCPLYNLMIENGLKVRTAQVDKMYLMGTPIELNFFKNHVNKHFGEKPIALCSDHSGFELKEITKQILDDKGLKYIDFGTYVKKDCDYNDYVKQVTQFIQDKYCDFGFVFCRSGQGVNMAANKQKGIRSSLISDEWTAEMSVRHGCSNVFAFSEKSIDKDLMEKCIDKIQNNTFDGGRHINRVQRLNEN
jgi:RpiB/LacA/LacB family sugar-phosphate isomerase